MKKYITDIQESTALINIDLVCKEWNDKFVINTNEKINTNKNETDVEYTFIIYGKLKDSILIKTKISTEQALIVVNRLNLIHVKDIDRYFYYKYGSFHTKSFIDSEIIKLNKMKTDTEFELSIISNRLSQYKSC